jgi:hypothetical protein
MNDSNRKRRNVVLGTDLLESRALLNAHLPHSPMVHVSSLHAETSAPKPITGTLTLTSQTYGPASFGDFTVTVSASGSSTVGSASLSASYLVHDVASKPNVLVKQALKNGTGTLTLGNGSTLALKFSGTREAFLRVQPHTATFSLKGTATVQSGPNQGHVEKFTASASAPVATQFVTYRFTLK